MNRAKEIEKLANATTNDSRWLSVVERKTTADGTFYYSVKTIGVFCRPSCAARLARPENIEFHQTADDAEKAGFRACKRCKPKGPSIAQVNAAKIAKVCRLIERSQKSPSLEKLAEYAGLQVVYLVFKAGYSAEATDSPPVRTPPFSRTTFPLSGGVARGFTMG